MVDRTCELDNLWVVPREVRRGHGRKPPLVSGLHGAGPRLERAYDHNSSVALPHDRKGWLAGLRDPAVGRALALMHSDVARPWTSEQLAADVNLSRSAFADRFTQLVGVPPITYLIDWRMQLAAARLRDTPRAIGQIAAELGYESEATFTRAFKRAMGIAPGRYRSMGSSFTVAVGN